VKEYGITRAPRSFCPARSGLTVTSTPDARPRHASSRNRVEFVRSFDAATPAPARLLILPDVAVWISTLERLRQRVPAFPKFNQGVGQPNLPVPARQREGPDSARTRRLLSKSLLVLGSMDDLADRSARTI
jgi:hypothetical protein